MAVRRRERRLAIFRAIWSSISAQAPPLRLTTHQAAESAVKRFASANIIPTGVVLSQFNYKHSHYYYDKYHYYNKEYYGGGY